MKEVFPHQVLGLRLVSSALRVMSPQTGTSGAAAGAGLGHVLTDKRVDCYFEEKYGTIFMSCLHCSDINRLNCNLLVMAGFSNKLVKQRFMNYLLKKH